MLSGLILLYGHCSVTPPLPSVNTQVLLREVCEYIDCSEKDLVWNSECRKTFFVFFC